MRQEKKVKFKYGDPEKVADVREEGGCSVLLAGGGARRDSRIGGFGQKLVVSHERPSTGVEGRAR